MYRSVHLLVLFTIVSSASAFILSLEKTALKCRKEARAEENKVVIIDEDFQTLSKNSIAKCYVACMLREMDMVNAAGYLNVQFLTASLPSDLGDHNEAIEALKTCAEQTGDNFCERGFKVDVCLEAKPILHVNTIV